MGFLAVGTPLTWKDSLKYHNYIKRHGVQQFLKVFERVKGRSNDVLRWGDEVEYILVKLDPRTRAPKLLLRAPEIIEKLNSCDKPCGCEILSWCYVICY
jgi:glutamate--cysteine ligase catalytic subunit